MKINSIFESDYVYNIDLIPETPEEVGLLLRLKNQHCKEGISENFNFTKAPYVWIQFKRKKKTFRKTNL